MRLQRPVCSTGSFRIGHHHRAAELLNSLSNGLMVRGSNGAFGRVARCADSYVCWMSGLPVSANSSFSGKRVEWSLAGITMKLVIAKVRLNDGVMREWNMASECSGMFDSLACCLGSLMRSRRDGFAKNQTRFAQ